MSLNFPSPPSLSAAPRLFYPASLASTHEGAVLPLPAEAAQHAVRALRMRAGDALVLFDGQGGEYAATLADVGKREVTVCRGPWRAIERESCLPIRLVQCVQGGDKMDFTIQKAVELGVAEIVPVISQRSVVRLDGERALKRLEHWRQIIIAASEQCGRNRLCVVQPISDYDSWVVQAGAAVDGAQRILLSPLASASIVSLSRPSAVELLVGPEGGLAPREMDTALRACFSPIRLGPRVLRTETAGLAVLAAIHARWGDFI